MTMRIRIRDPTCPDMGKVDLPDLDRLHDNPTEIYLDLDDPEDREKFEEIFGEDMLVRAEHLEEGETLEITCVERVDEWADPTPAPELIPEECSACGTVPELVQSPEGYRFRCPKCRVTTLPHGTILGAAEAWGAVQW